MRKVLLQAQLWSRELTSADERTGVALPEPIGDVSTGVCRTKKIQIATEAPSAELGDAKAGLGAQTAVWRVGTCKEDESELDTCPEATQPRSLWPTGTVRELQLDAAHRSLPALADVALPCQLAAAVAAHQTLQTLRAAQVAERAAAVLAARVYGVLDAEEASAARLRKEIQEAKAAAKAAEKAEVAERRRLAREAKRAAQRVADEENETGGDFGEGALLDDLEDVPIGRLSFCGNEAGVSLEIAHVPGARKGRRGRRRAIEEDDDVSGGACDVTLANGPASEPDQTAGRTGGLAEALEDSHVDQACGVCGRTDGEDAMLLCDRRGCLGALHMYCADPPMAEVPEGDWFCAECLKGKENGIGRWGVNALEGGGPQERPAGGGVKETDPGGGGEEEGRVSGHEGLRTDGGNEQTMAGGGRGENRSVEGGGEGTRLSAKEEGKEQVPGDRLNVLVSKAEEVEPPGGEREADETGGVEVENNMQEAQGRVVDEEPSGQAGTGPTEGDAGYLGKPREGPVEVATPPDGHREHEQMRVNERAEAIESGFSGGGSLPGLHRPVEKGSQPEGAADVSMKGVAELRAGDVQRALVVTESGAAVAPTDAPVDAVDVASHMPGGLDRMPVLTAEATAQLADADDPRPAVLESSSDLKCAALSEQPLAKVEPLRPDEMRGLVSTASREAVTVTAAVWGLADDLSASELMSQSRGVGSGADATPCDELDLGVPRQAAACLAYASLRWKVDTCQGVTGPKGGASDLGINSTGTEPGAESEGKLDQGDGQLLAAAGDEAALCGFLSGRGGAGEPTWLRLRMGASAEQNDLNR